MGIIIVGGIIEKDGKFLLVEETKEEYRGKWNIPAGHLEPNETIFEGAIREIKEEARCNVELTGVLQVGNVVMKNNTFVSVIFSTKLLEENIKYDSDELLNAKWFTYEELLNMKNELRTYDWIMSSITALRKNKAVNIDLVKVCEL